MADVYGPFLNSPWGSEADWARYAPAWAPSGPIGFGAANATSGDWAFAATGLSVSAGAGRAWVRGFGITRTGSVPTHAVSANTHATWSRRDRLVLRRDLAAGTITTAVIAGVAGSTPAAPALTQVETGVWEEALFSFLVPPNSGTTITGIVDERNWVRPDGRGYLLVPSPSAAGDVATKGYVDALGTTAKTPNTVARRDGNGWIAAVGVWQLDPPFAADHAATKGYVDGLTTDTGWVAVPTNGGRGAYQNPAVRKIGKVVHARGGWTDTGMSANGFFDVATIPVGFRPGTTMVFSPGMTSAGSVGRLVVYADGVVQVTTGNPVAGYFKMDGFSWLTD